MINLGDEFMKRDAQYQQRLLELALEYYQLNERRREVEHRLDEIDLLISNILGAKQVNGQAAKDFDAYLAIKEGALTLGDIQKGVQVTKVEKEK